MIFLIFPDISKLMNVIFYSLIQCVNIWNICVIQNTDISKWSVPHVTIQIKDLFKLQERVIELNVIKGMKSSWYGFWFHTATLKATTCQVLAYYQRYTQLTENY